MHVPKADPFLLDQQLEAAHSAIIGVKHQLGQRHNLCGAVPAVAAMRQYRLTAILHLINTEHRRLKHKAQVLKPLRRLEARQPVHALALLRAQLQQRAQLAVTVFGGVDVGDAKEFDLAVDV